MFRKLGMAVRELLVRAQITLKAKRMGRSAFGQPSRAVGSLLEVQVLKLQTTKT